MIGNLSSSLIGDGLVIGDGALIGPRSEMRITTIHSLFKNANLKMQKTVIKRFRTRRCMEDK